MRAGIGVVKNGVPIDAAELSVAAEHLAFDFFYFRLYSRLNKDVALAFSLHAAHQAITYALLLHFRVLLDFFYVDPVKDDCCVSHFIELLPEFKTNFGEINEPSTLKEVRDNLHKRLAHMTATRWRERRPEMDYYERYFAGIDSLIERFTKALPASVRTGFDLRWRELEARNRAASGTAS